MYDMRGELADSDVALLKPYNFLTFKPFVYVLNVGESDLSDA